MKNIFYVTLFLGIAACGDNDTNIVDGNQECIGHECPGAPIRLPEGGEVRLELVFFNDGPQEVHAGAWFASAQMPEQRTFPEGFPIVGTEFCTDMTSGEFFPSGSPVSRTYTDVGESVVLASQERTIDLSKFDDLDDPAFIDVKHDIGYADEFLNVDDISFGEYSVDIGEESLNEILEMPENYQITSHEFTGPIPLQSENLLLEWTAPEADAADFRKWSFVAFGDLEKVNTICFGPNNGRMLVPSETVRSVPASGFLQHGVLSHTVADRESRRVDLIGINCQATSYFKVP